MKGYGREEQNPLGLGGLAKAESDPKIAKWLKEDIMFRNQFDLCKRDPNMIMQLMQQDPRWMEVFKLLTGIDLGAFAEAKHKEDEEKKKKKEEMDKIKEQMMREQEEKRKQEEFEKMPEEEKKRIKTLKDAETKKNQGNEFYKQKKFAQAITCYNDAILLDPSELTYYTNLAACYFELAEYDKCIEQCDNAVAEGRKTGAYDFVKMGKAIARKANALFK